MATQPPRKGTPKDGEPLWVDADWWREMLRGRDPVPAPPETSPGAAAEPDGPTAPQPVHQERPPAPVEAETARPEPGVDGPPLQAPPQPPAAVTPPAVPPPPPAAAQGSPPATGDLSSGDEAPAPVRGARTPTETPATGAPAPPAVPRAKRPSRVAEPAAPAPEPHVSGVAPQRPQAPGPEDAARTVLPSPPETKPTRKQARQAARPPKAEAPVPPVKPVPPPSVYVPPDGDRPRVVDFFLRHLGDLALLLLAAGVITLVYLVLGR